MTSAFLFVCEKLQQQTMELALLKISFATCVQRKKRARQDFSISSRV